MAEQESDPSEPLDVKRIHQLVRLMKRYDLTDLNLSDGKVQIRLKRRGSEVTTARPPCRPGARPRSIRSPRRHRRLARPVPSPHPRKPRPRPRRSSSKAPWSVPIMPRPPRTPPPFVSVGSVVQPDSTLCIIEAMKVFTDIPAGVSGTIAEILVKNGQPVEFGQPLFRVVPA